MKNAERNKNMKAFGNYMRAHTPSGHFPPCPPSLREGGNRQNLRFASAKRLQISNFAIFFPSLEGQGRGWDVLPNALKYKKLCVLNVVSNEYFQETRLWLL
jgi:hypothetical protein